MAFPYLHAILFLTRNVLARPQPPHVLSANSFDPREIISAKFTQRSEWNIIWSCLATLFACSWVAIHPNIPAPSDNRWRVLSRRLLMMFYMLLAPEIVIVWAGRQKYAALEIAERNKERGWTRTHAFFALMGGFVLYEDGAMSRVLSPDELENLFAEGRIDWPIISEKEIEDRSKSDIFSKGFAILQTTWFVTQCIVRRAYKLPLSHLEIATVAFAVLNAVVYFLWWNKPMDVGCPVPVHLLPPLTKPQCSPSKREIGIQTHGHYHSDADGNASQISLEPSTFVSGTEPIDKVDPQVFTNLKLESNLSGQHSSTTLQTFALAMSKTEPINEVDTQSVTKHEIPSNIPESHSSTPLRHSSAFASVCSYIRNKLLPMGPLAILYLLIYHLGKPAVVIWSDLGQMVTSDTVDNHHGTQSVPNFYAPESRKSEPSVLIGLIVGTLFGGIHCIAWSFHFSSTNEHLWRISAVIITAAPTITLTIGLIFGSRFFGGILTLLLVSAYTVARVILFILPFLALHSLPSDSFIAVDWVAFIPHI